MFFSVWIWTYVVIIRTDVLHCIQCFNTLQSCKWLSTSRRNLLPPFSAMKLKTAAFSEALVITYKSKHCQSPKYHNLNSHRIKFNTLRALKNRVLKRMLLLKHERDEIRADRENYIMRDFIICNIHKIVIIRITVIIIIIIIIMVSFMSTFFLHFSLLSLVFYFSSLKFSFSPNSI